MADQKPIPFEGLKPLAAQRNQWINALMFYRVVGTRPPKKGEWYLSGAILEAWRAPNDLTTAYQIAVPTHYAVPRTGYDRGPVYG
jgi:hypothetical protein